MPDLSDLSTEPDAPAAPATHVTLTGRTRGKPDRPQVLAIAIPRDYVVLSEIRSYATRCGEDGAMLLRLASATVALCCPALGRMLVKAGIGYDKSGYDVGIYGRSVYRWLHDEGVTDSEIHGSLSILFPRVLAEGWPSEDEVQTALGK
jgi:hypothetical protein